jgi:hypothetical protein
MLGAGTDNLRVRSKQSGYAAKARPIGAPVVENKVRQKVNA